MATVERIPYLYWRDHAGAVTGALLEDEDGLATGASLKDVERQLREYLDWHQRTHQWTDGTELEELKVHDLAVGVRPSYRTERRYYPYVDELRVRIPCVTGKTESGVFLGALPMIGVVFYFHDHAELRPLVEQHVRGHLASLEPRQVARYMTPLAEVGTGVLSVRARPDRGSQEDWRSGLPALDAVADPLGRRAARLGLSYAWERDAETGHLVERLRDGQSSLLLVGDGGVGKTTLLASAARQLERESRQGRADDDDDTRGRAPRFWFTRAGRIIAGMSYLGQWQARCERVVDELTRISGVLCVERLIDLVRVGGGGAAAGIAAFLRPYLEHGEVRVVAECTQRELDACRRLLPGFADLFETVRVEPLSPAAATRVVERLTTIRAQRHRLEAVGPIAATVLRLLRRFLPYDSPPKRAVSLLDRAFEDVRERGDEAVDVAAVTDSFRRMTGLPEHLLGDDPLEPDAVNAWFEERIRGQIEATAAVTSVVTTFKAALNDPQRPLATLLFCGPTGVGKTELARALASYLFGAGDDADQRLVRLDMSELAGADAGDRLIQKPDGEASELVRRLRRQPFSVVLLDEIEKASAAVFDVLLGALDEGRLTDPWGRVTSFRSAVVIMTSNLGAQTTASVGFAGDTLPSFRKAVADFFRPEFSNRIDRVVTFAPLASDTIRQIAGRELAAVGEREGLDARRLRLTWTDAVVEVLARLGFDRRYGARPLQRTVEEMVVAPLSRFLVEHPELHDAGIEVDVADDARCVVRLA